MDLEEHYVACACSDFNHVFRFVFDPDDGDLWLEVQLRQWRPWYKRAWIALRYAFGLQQAYGHYDVTVLKSADFARLHALLDRAEAFDRARSAAAALGSLQNKPVL